MSQYLSRKTLLNATRKNRFSVKFMKDLENLISTVSVEITEKHIKDGTYARRLNISLAFFIHDALSLMDRGFVFSLIKTYLKKVGAIIIITHELAKFLQQIKNIFEFHRKIINFFCET